MNDVLKTLTIKSLHIENAEFSNKTDIIGNKLYVTNEIDISQYQDIKSVNLNIINKDFRNVEVNSILDIIPISTKVYGELGTGLTHTLTGVYVLLTSSINNEKQVSNFGACYGNLKDIVQEDMPGTYGKDDILIHIDVTIKDEQDLKKSVYNCHSICEIFINDVRDKLKELSSSIFTESHTFQEKYRKNAKRVVLVKQISGQGAMENNIILPDEPSGVKGGETILDLHNSPIMISPNEYRDGAIRALT